MSKLNLAVFKRILFVATRYDLTKKCKEAGCRSLTPVVLATQEAEIRRIVVQSQPWSK
jgi:hypothetical protein